MPTIDLSTPPPAPTSLLDGLPRRLVLTLPELQLLAGRAGNAPLPFAVADPEPANPLEQRLGRSRSSGEAAAHRAALAGLPDPAESLARRGLVDGDTSDRGLTGALGLIAAPDVALDLDVSVDGHRARAWHRQRGDALATLATADGIAFELAWASSAAWPEELRRAAALPGDLRLTESAAPAHLDAPFEVLDAGAEAVRSGRTDLLAAILERHAGEVHDEHGATLDPAATAAAINALCTEARGRLRALVADVTDDARTVGVVSLTLLADGWHALTPRRVDGRSRTTIRKVDADDLPSLLAPVLAEVHA